jgi:glyoxylase-like metal-dependent hydrolase (beta-lactamase superfamily II)
MDGANGLKEPARVAVPVASSTLSVNVFTAPGKAMVGERPKPFGEPLGFDPITSTLIYGENDAVLVDAMTTVAEAEALADWVGLHNRNLETIYITHAHFDHFYGLSILLERFPDARAIATPKTVSAMQMSFTPTVERLARRMFPGQVATKLRSARLSLGDPGHQALPLGLRSGAENRDVRPGSVRSMFSSAHRNWGP